MNRSSPALRAAIGCEYWLPTLQLAGQEVFEFMLACPLEVPQRTPPDENLDITSMVGLSGKMCGILTMRCSAKSAATITTISASRPWLEAWPPAVASASRL